MRHIDNAVCRKCAGRQQQKKKQNGYGRRFHRRKNNPFDQSSNEIDVSVGDFDDLHLNSDADIRGAGNVAPQFEGRELYSYELLSRFLEFEAAWL